MPNAADALPLPVERVVVTPLRVTPEIIEYYTMRARDMRAEAIRSIPGALWSLLTKIVRRIDGNQSNSQTRVMRATITIIISAATVVGVGPALADCGSSNKPAYVGVVGGNPETDTFGFLCSRHIEQTGSVTAAIGAGVTQVGTGTGDPEKDTFGYIQAPSTQ